MNASELREWVALFLPDLVADGQGGGYEAIPSGLVYDRAAAVRTVTGRASAINDQMADRIEYKVRIRFDQAVTTSQRVYWRDMYLDIVNVENVDNADAWLILTCVQREAGKS
jgi:head-tail adaptor